MAKKRYFTTFKDCVILQQTFHPNAPFPETRVITSGEYTKICSHWRGEIHFDGVSELQDEMASKTDGTIRGSDILIVDSVGREQKYLLVKVKQIPDKDENLLFKGNDFGGAPNKTEYLIKFNVNERVQDCRDIPR